MPDDTYLRQVAAALETQGVAAERCGDLVAEMHSHLVDSGEDPTEAFGPPEVFAERLAGRVPADVDEAGNGDWDRDRARSVVREEMQTNRQLAEEGWSPAWKGRPFYRQRGRWYSPREPDSVLDAVAAFISTHRGKVLARDSDVITARLGSRVAFRAFGVFMKTGRSRLPIRFRVAVLPNTGGTDVEVAVEEDAGRYLVGLSMTTVPYERAFAELLETLRTTTEARSSPGDPMPSPPDSAPQPPSGSSGSP